MPFRSRVVCRDESKCHNFIAFLVEPNLNAITLQHSSRLLLLLLFGWLLLLLFLFVCLLFLFFVVWCGEVVFLYLFLFVISNDKISLLPCSVFAFLLRSTESEQNQAGFGRLELYTVSPNNPQYSESQQLIIQ